jgi:hypothetical protein
LKPLLGVRALCLESGLGFEKGMRLQRRKRGRRMRRESWKLERGDE